MKKISAKIKITIWYTAILIIIMTFVLIFVIVISDKMVYSEAEVELAEKVEEFIHEIEFEDERLELDDDLKYYDDGVSFSIYDGEGRQLAGIIPSSFPGYLMLESNVNQRVESDGKQWLVHDIAYKYNADEIIWIRGIVSLNSTVWMLQAILAAALVICPFVVVIGSVGGYIVTKRALKPVEESYEREKRFTADASHELRTPVSVIIAQSEYGLDIVEPEEKDEALKVVLRQANKMASLISQLLKLTRLTNEKEQITVEKVDLVELIHIIMEELEEKAEKYNISLITNCPNQVYFKGNQDLLTQMFINLIENGIFYGKKGGFVEISIEKEKNRIVCVVKDNGIGIAKEEQDKIWDRFYRVDKSRKSHEENNSGIGLYMVKWIVQEHNGEIHLESEVGKGSTFYVFLPAVNSI